MAKGIQGGGGKGVCRRQERCPPGTGILKRRGGVARSRELGFWRLSWGIGIGMSGEEGIFCDLSGRCGQRSRKGKVRAKVQAPPIHSKEEPVGESRDRKTETGLGLGRRFSGQGVCHTSMTPESGSIAPL